MIIEHASNIFKFSSLAMGCMKCSLALSKKALMAALCHSCGA
jgi:hypothetical protein